MINQNVLLKIDQKNGLKKIVKMQNLLLNELEQIKRMNNLSLNRKSQVAKARGIKTNMNILKEDLLIAFLKSNQSHTELRRSEDNNAEIGETKKNLINLEIIFQKKK